MNDTVSAANGFFNGDSPPVSTVSLGRTEAAQHDAEISDWIYGHFISKTSVQADDFCDPSIAQDFHFARLPIDEGIDFLQPGEPKDKRLGSQVCDEHVD